MMQPACRDNARRGFTLTEVLIASVSSGVVLAGIFGLYLGQFRMNKEVTDRSEFGMERLMPTFVVARIVKHIERADRIYIPSAENILLRTVEFATPACTAPVVAAGNVPPASCLDDAANFRWDQYRWNVGLQSLDYYPDMRSAGGTKQCNPVTLITGITAGSFVFRDSGAAALGTEPFGVGKLEDNNVIAYQIRWNGTFKGAGGDIPRQNLYQGEAVPRNLAYANINSNSPVGDSGSGLTLATVSPPPTDGFCP